MGWSNLITLVIGGLIGAAIQYYRDVLTENRRRSEDFAENFAKFGRVRASMPQLIEEMIADVRENPLRREIAILERAGMGFSPSHDCLIYYESTHPNLHDFVTILQNVGYIERIKPERDAEWYRMSEEFAELLLRV